VSPKCLHFLKKLLILRSYILKKSKFVVDRKKLYPIILTILSSIYIGEKMAEKENRKEKIFAAAASSFTEYGYFKTSMEMVSNKAGMTLRGLYYHFKSKDDLFLQLFQYMNSKYYSQIKDEAEMVKGPEEKLKMYARIASKVLKENTDFLKICQEFLAIGTRNAEVRKVMTSFYSNQVDRIKTIVEEGIESGCFIKTDAEKVARAIVLITMGVFNFHFSLDSDFDPAQQHTFDIEHILRGLKSFSLEKVS
jgi:AcrR family transcriptional regulator